MQPYNSTGTDDTAVDEGSPYTTIPPTDTPPCSPVFADSISPFVADLRRSELTEPHDGNKLASGTAVSKRSTLRIVIYNISILADIINKLSSNRINAIYTLLVYRGKATHSKTASELAISSIVLG